MNNLKCDPFAKVLSLALVFSEGVQWHVYVCLDILAMTPFTGLVTVDKERKSTGQNPLPFQGEKNHDASPSTAITVIAGILKCTLL